MFEWFDTNFLYWHWIVIGLILVTVELFVPVFVLVWLGVSSIVIGILSFFIPMSFGFELVLFGFLSVLFLLLWHKFVSPKITNQTLAGLSKEAMIGQIGMVISYNDDQGRGKLKFPAPVVGNDEWEFIYSGELENGDKVKVTDISGNSLIVKLSS